MQLTHDTTPMSSTNPNTQSDGYLGTYIIEGRAFMRVRGTVRAYDEGESRIKPPKAMPFHDDALVHVHTDTGRSCVGIMREHRQGSCIYLPEDHTDAEELFISVIA